MAKSNGDSELEGMGLSAGIAENIRQPKLSHVVASRLRDQILAGKLATGSLLPPESKLLSIFGVSRPTLREALRILEAEGLINVARGMRNGPVVLGPSNKKAVEYTSFVLVAEGVTMSDLHEARMFIEPEIIRTLKGDGLATAAKELREWVDEITRALNEHRYVDVVAGTNRFHEALARASGNRTMAMLVGMLQSITDDVYTAILSTDTSTPADALERNMSKTVAGYTTLCDLLEKGKTEEAASFWRRYMERSLEFLRRSRLGERRLVSNSSGPTLAVERARDSI